MPRERADVLVILLCQREHCLTDVFCLSPVFFLWIWLKARNDKKLSKRAFIDKYTISRPYVDSVSISFRPLSFTLVCSLSCVKPHLLLFLPLFLLSFPFSPSHPVLHFSCFPILSPVSLGGHLWQEKASICDSTGSLPCGQVMIQTHSQTYSYTSAHTHMLAKTA